MKSVIANPYCSAGAAKDAMEAVWDVCYNDTQPFDRAPWSMFTANAKLAGAQSSCIQENDRFLQQGVCSDFLVSFDRIQEEDSFTS